MTPRDILIIKPSSLGDVVHTLPAVALIKKHWPNARLRWLVNPEWAPLLEGNPDIDETLIFPRQQFRGLRGILRFPGWARDFGRRHPAGLVLDFQCLLRSGLIARQSCAPGGRIVGLSDAREGAGLFYHQKVDVTGIAHAVDRYLALVSALGIPITQPLEWPLPAGTAPVGFQETPPYLLLHPFSRGAGKSLTPSDVAAFCQALAPTRILLVGRSEEAVPAAANVENLLNRTTLAELIWLIRRANFVVSVDSGPMHIAAALTPRLLSIHTWSDPAKVGPYHPEAWVWKDGQLFQRNQSASPMYQAKDLPAVADFMRART
ncbi:glycosyl transferase family 9 [Chthoniobacter flavus Ellin428]|uniref:Glycosyl transferase family 9 n=1 Tax=Chthoniobacter flavus Ellin428 TaxID=497964 RepID=B4CXA6_9BACT|nr:glycosyltransferase family 9 protein [Chthoniobacter flavus]EDY20904.1 glycosyl transferase family 9 [Chthoniobacter flavus Ellin428]TCO88638.1 heptosyltransferase-1 [Chthoniobacter flavus]